MRIYLKRIKVNPGQHGYVTYNFKTGEFKTRKTKPKKDTTIQSKNQKGFAGPLWLGKLWDTKLVKKMILTVDKEAEKNKSTVTSGKSNSLIRHLYDESKIGTVGFYDISALAKIYKIPQLPRRANIVEKLKEKGFNSVVTHITPSGLRTGAPLKLVLKAVYG